jgi:hypothetical protein
MKKYVYAFGGGTADGDGKMKDTLGGKGAGLAEMSRAGVPVPPGFTISTEVCNIYFDNNKKIPAEIEAESKAALGGLEKKMGQKLGATENPLLVSVRSCEILDARHDGHDSEPGAKRPDGRGLGGEERQRALCLRLLSPLHPDVRQCRAGN